MYLPTNVPQ